MRINEYKADDLQLEALMRWLIRWIWRWSMIATMMLISNNSRCLECISTPIVAYCCGYCGVLISMRCLFLHCYWSIQSSIANEGFFVGKKCVLRRVQYCVSATCYLSKSLVNWAGDSGWLLTERLVVLLVCVIVEVICCYWREKFMIWSVRCRLADWELLASFFQHHI